MNSLRIQELAALPLPGVVASAPDEYERRRTAYAIRIAVNEALEEAKRIAIDYRDGGELAPQRIEEEIEALKLP